MVQSQSSMRVSHLGPGTEMKSDRSEFVDRWVSYNNYMQKKEMYGGRKRTCAGLSLSWFDVNTSLVTKLIQNKCSEKALLLITSELRSTHKVEGSVRASTKMCRKKQATRRHSTETHADDRFVEVNSSIRIDYNNAKGKLTLINPLIGLNVFS